MTAILEHRGNDANLSRIVERPLSEPCSQYLMGFAKERPVLAAFFMSRQIAKASL